MNHTDVAVIVEQTESYGSLLCQCGECGAQFIKDLEPRVVELLVESRVKLHINADLGDPEVRRQILDAETVINTHAELERSRDTRFPFSLVDLGDVDPEFLLPRLEGKPFGIKNV